MVNALLKSEKETASGGAAEPEQQDEDGPDSDDQVQCTEDICDGGPANHWDAYAIQQCETFVTFIKWQPTEDELTRELRATPAVLCEGRMLHASV